MFRVTMGPSSGEATVFMRHLILVILCGWLSGMQGGIHSTLHTMSFVFSTIFRPTTKYYYIHCIILSLEIQRWGYGFHDGIRFSKSSYAESVIKKVTTFSEHPLIRLSLISTTIRLVVVENWGNLVFNGFCTKSLVVGSVLSDTFLSGENLFDVGISESSGLYIYIYIYIYMYCLWFLNIVYTLMISWC
jgi:hypothetical protein